MNRTLGASALVALTLGSVTHHAQPQPPGFTAKTAAVVIDVVVLDKRGRPVLDLTKDDFELREDRVPQHLQLCTLVGPTAPVADGSKPGQSPRPTAPAPVSQPGPGSAALEARIPSLDTPVVSALLFDRLGPEARPLARHAALAYVETLTSPRDMAGVFLADLSFQTFQPFTNDRDQLRQAVDRVAMTAPTNFDRQSQLAMSGIAQQLDPAVPPTAGAEMQGGGTATALQRQRLLDQMSPSDRAMAAMQFRMEQSYQRLLSESEGQATIAGLTAVIRAMASARGRKSVIYYSEGITLTARTRPLFDALIQEANTASVTVYAIDAAGLRVHSKEAETSRHVDVAGAQGVGDVQRDPSAPWTRELENQEQVLTSRPAAALGRLANETGGFLLQDTNDLGASVDRIQQERGNYYLLLYESSNAREDGRFRKVAVKVKRKGVQVRARAGYLVQARSDTKD